MTVLSNFPMVSQLTSVTSDGQPSENAQFDCVPASIGAALLWFAGKTQWDTDINPDKLKDAAYGQDWHNAGTAASAFVAFCAERGVKLYPFSGIPGVLVGRAHSELQAGHPVVFTEPDPYVSASLGWSHVCVFYAEEPGYLTALDPYIGRAVKRTDSEWANLLLYNQLWILEKESDEDVPKTIDLSDPNVAHYFELANNDGTQWRSRVATNGKQSIIQFGILDAYRRYGGDALCGLTYLGLPMSGEIPLPGIPGAVKQVFERGVLVYDPTHKLDNPPGSGPVYAAHLYNGGPGQDPRVAALQGQVTQLQQQSSNQDSADAQAAAKLAQIKAIVTA